MTAATVERWEPSERRMRVHASAPSYLVVNENYNAGWQAWRAGRPLTPIRLDGWRQAWLLPAGDAAVTMVYAPDRPYRLALLGGLVLAALVVLLAAVPARGGRRLPLATGPARPGRRAVLPAFVALPVLAALGFWTVGWTGAAVLVAVFSSVSWARAIAAAGRGGGPLVRATRILASPWLPATGLALAGCAAAAEAYLKAVEADLPTMILIEPTTQLLCLFSLAHLAASVVGKIPDISPVRKTS
jgi:arabinofuranan 3-O-arabinosyltransferase